MTIMTTVSPPQPELTRVREDISKPEQVTENRVLGEHRRRARLVLREVYDDFQDAIADGAAHSASTRLQAIQIRLHLLTLERYYGIFPGDFE